MALRICTGRVTFIKCHYNNYTHTTTRSNIKIIISKLAFIEIYLQKIIYGIFRSNVILHLKAQLNVLKYFEISPTWFSVLHGEEKFSRSVCLQKSVGSCKCCWSRFINYKVHNGMSLVKSHWVFYKRSTE